MLCESYNRREAIEKMAIAAAAFVIQKPSFDWTSGLTDIKPTTASQTVAMTDEMQETFVAGNFAVANAEGKEKSANG
jgi:hypothetical protein